MVTGSWSRTLGLVSCLTLVSSLPIFPAEAEIRTATAGDGHQTGNREASVRPATEDAERQALADTHVQTFTASHAYAAGANDSRNDARELCFLEAKRKLRGKVENYLRSHADLTNGRLTTDQIRSYLAAVLGIEIVNEGLGFSNGQNMLILTVQADVDLAGLRKQLQVLVEDPSLRQRVEEHQQQLQRLEEQVRQLNARVALAPAGSATEFQKERNAALDAMHNLEQQMIAAVNLRRLEVEKERQTSTMVKIRKSIRRGMTAGDVLAIMGPPVRKEALGAQWVYEGAYICFSEEQFARKPSPELRVHGAGTDQRCELDFLK